MTTRYKAPVRDYLFVMYELLGFEGNRDVIGCPELDADTCKAILEEAARLAEDVVHPLNQLGDEVGCKFNDGEVSVPAGFAEAYKLYGESGWCALSVAEEYGGQGMPSVLRTLTNEIFYAANHAWFMYATLTEGACDALAEWGNDDLKARYLPKLAEGAWTGTMNLTEPQAGTDLGQIRTRAVPQADGQYRISGTKIFISAGEHDMAENIIHLVLARIEGAPAGTRGISLFLVPKYQVNDDGSLGERNGVSCASIEHKMGIRASATCVLNYDSAVGYLVGEENRGLQAMFTMMNNARLGVGVEGLGKAEVSYQNACDYAKERLQGRSSRSANSPAPLVEHADVRRMLLTMRAFTEGARALAAYVALQGDISRRHPDADQRSKAADIVGLLTPVVKAFFTDEGYAAANLAVQVYGGHGYISEHGIEQFVRDGRISQLYEGTNGVQALDLVQRKLPLNQGAAVQAFFAMIDETIRQNGDDAADAMISKLLTEALGSLRMATDWLNSQRATQPDDLGGACVDYLRLFAIVTTGWLWLSSVRVCRERLEEGAGEVDFYQTKLLVARVYAERYLTEHSSLLAKIQCGSQTMMAVPVEAL